MSGIEIKGNVGAAFNTGHGSTIHININSTKNGEPPDGLTSSVYRLSKVCEFYNLRPSIERIAKSLYGTRHFKNLTVEQVNMLIIIAMEFSSLMPKKAVVPTMDFGFTPDRPPIGEPVESAQDDPSTECDETQVSESPTV